MSSKHKFSNNSRRTKSHLEIVPSVHITAQDVTRWFVHATRQLHNHAWGATDDLVLSQFHDEHSYQEALATARKLEAVARKADEIFADFVKLRQDLIDMREEFYDFDENSEPDLAPECRKFLK